MCGRLFQKTPSAEAARIFATTNPVPNVPPRYNGAPTQDILAVRFNTETRERSLDVLHWGLIPIWAKDRKIEYSTIIARGETVQSKPVFHDAFAKRRCIIPVLRVEGTEGRQAALRDRAQGRQLATACRPVGSLEASGLRRDRAVLHDRDLRCR
jgi:SOS response associated peptidase (SRAP)